MFSNLQLYNDCVATAEQDSDQCDFGGCTQPKRKEPDGTRIRDYCCRDHAVQDNPNRDNIKIL